MAAVGNLNDYVKYQMAQGLEKGGAGVGGIGAEMAVGMADGAADDEPAGRHRGAGDAAGGGRPRRAGRQCRRRSSPADAAKVLGVSEADVIASLEAGDLKGKKIGTQWRITRAQLAEFLQVAVGRPT